MMIEKVVKLTKDGFKELEKKLRIMKTEGRQEVAELIRQAKEFGQLDENVEYENAKEEQAKIETEISRLEEVLSHAVIIEEGQIKGGTVDIGSIIKVANIDEGKEYSFQIVSPQESDPGHKPPRISDESPLGSAFINRTVGEEVTVEIPLGVVRYKIISL